MRPPLWTFERKPYSKRDVGNIEKHAAWPGGRILLLRKQVVLLKAMSFALIGVVNSLVDFAVFLFTLRTSRAVAGQRLDLIAANVLAWMVAVSGSYVMNSYVTFAAESGRKLRWKSFFAFVASGILGVHRQYRDAPGRGRIHAGDGRRRSLAIGVGFLVNFSMSHFVVFRPQTEDGAAERPSLSHRTVAAFQASRT